MDDQPNRSPLAQLRTDFRRPTGTPTNADELLDEQAETSTSIPRRRKEPTTDQFTGALTATQFKLPADLLASLKLHAIHTGETMSAIVLRCLTSTALVEKAWISTRKAG